MSPRSLTPKRQLTAHDADFLFPDLEGAYVHVIGGGTRILTAQTLIVDGGVL